MNDWKSLLLNPNTSLREAIAKVDMGCRQIALVADEHCHLLGTLADGDIRRAILADKDLGIPCSQVMNPNPKTASPKTTKDQLLTIMRRGAFHQVPLVDANGYLVGLVTIDELINTNERSNWIILMAGGIGSRLYPLTEECPKPLLPVGGSPILENILMSFIGHGFRNFFFSVSYKANMIVDYFGDGSKWGVNIAYLHETHPKGTAGALSLLPLVPEEPVFVMNGDLLTQANFLDMLDFHNSNAAIATMAVREFDYQVPYGVVNVHKETIVSIDEKPIHKFLVSSGIYVIAPEALSLIPKEVHFDMPMLFKLLEINKKRTVAYKLNDYWIDIGRIEELERAHQEWTVG